MWMFNGAEISSLQDITFAPNNLNHTLTLNRADVSNSGQYTCHLIQNFNTAISRTITLEVVQSMFIYVYICNCVYAYSELLRNMDTCTYVLDTKN